MSYTVSIKHFKNRIASIIEFEKQRLEQRLKTKFTEQEIEMVKNKSFDMLNFEYRKLCTYNGGGHISTLSEITLSNITEDEYNVYLLSSPNKNIKLSKSALEAELNNLLDQDFRTAIIYGLLGLRK